MVFKSRCIAVTADHGTATLAFGFGDEPANALNLTRLRELEAALDAVAAVPAIRILVLRSAIPAGFCAGICPAARRSLTHPADRAAFAWCGQQILRKFASLDAVSVALIDGPCLGVGFELALACDQRLCVARPTTLLGFPDRITCFGGWSRLRALAGRRGFDLLKSGKVISGREAQQLGLVDVACSERRANTELRQLLDRLEAHPLKSGQQVDWDGLADERRIFSAAPVPLSSNGPPVAAKAAPPFPATLGLLGNEAAIERIVCDAVLQGATAVLCGDRSGILAGIAESAARGFITPLEAEQSRLRVRASDTLNEFASAGLVFVTPGHNPFRLAAVVGPRAVVCVVRPAGGDPSRAHSQLAVPFPFSRRLVHIGFCESDRVALFPDTTTDSETLSSVAEWLRLFGFASVVFPVAARLLPRAA